MARKNGIYKDTHPSIKQAFADANKGSEEIFGSLGSKRVSSTKKRRKRKKKMS